MGKTGKNILKEELKRLKSMLEKVFKPGKENPQLILQPVRNKKFEGY